ncbi:hypothetical protein BDA99DRAFT_568523 [Phascolomyces articulosus]|uniref:Uncharacterized protein n=1 Tax=Phascolomyces articulosus TaxID=60185 RepID=A0AAD5PJC1_9FUNG|nr:hypothetical protein BDA99DRAFT_568523 [Phascolomyces articulosus]
MTANPIVTTSDLQTTIALPSLLLTRDQNKIQGKDKPASTRKVKLRDDQDKSDQSRVALESRTFLKVLVGELDVVTLQIHGLQITIVLSGGTKKINNNYAHYAKPVTKLPATIERDGASFAFYLYTQKFH